MENQSPTQEISNRNKEIRDNVKKQIKENLNYIYIVLMIIANALISLLQIKNGEIGLNYPDNGLGWVLWITQVLAVTFIGVMILGSFRRQGIKNGQKCIKSTYDEYIKLLTSKNDNTNPRSLKEYLNSRALKDSLLKGSIFALINILVLSIGISANLNSLMALIINILLATCFGIKAMLDAEDFVTTELVVWYKLEIKKLENNKEIQDGNGRNQKSRSRSTKSGRIQSSKKCDSRQSNLDSNVTA